MASSKKSVNPAEQVLTPTEQASAVTHVGLRRQRNEDAIFVDDTGRVLAVADGLGGHPAGDVASRTALECVAGAFTQFMTEGSGPTEKNGLEAIRTVVMDAHEQILEQANTRKGSAEMATTLIVAAIVEKRLYWAHVGDVRGYVFRNGSVEHVTTDHSLVAELVAKGEIQPEDVNSHPDRNIVTQALGLTGPLEPGSASIRIQSGDAVLLCSDGLWELVSSEQMIATLGGAGNLRAKLNRLVELALEGGGHDNISVAVYLHE